MLIVCIAESQTTNIYLHKVYTYVRTTYLLIHAYNMLSIANKLYNFIFLSENAKI